MKHKKIPAVAQPMCADVLQHFALIVIIKSLEVLQFGLVIDTLLEVIEGVHQNIIGCTFFGSQVDQVQTGA